MTLGVEDRLPARLLAVRVPKRVAAARRAKILAEAKREGETPSARKLALAEWTLLVTNAPPEVLAIREALVLARARWQIELLFKLWKDEGHLDEWRSADPTRILCEVYAKLVAMVLQHWLLLVGCWLLRRPLPDQGRPDGPRPRDRPPPGLRRPALECSRCCTPSAAAWPPAAVSTTAAATPACSNCSPIPPSAA